MAAIRKRGRAWVAEVCVNKVRRSRSFRSKAAARAWADEEERRLEAGTLAPMGATVGTLLEEYCRRVTARKRSRKWETARIDALKADRLAATPLETLTTAQVSEWRDRRLQSVTSATVRRDWNLLSHACQVAHKEWRWLAGNPFREVTRPSPPPHRERVMAAEEIERLCFALGYDRGEPAGISQRVAVCLLVALETAMRQSELAGLTWDRVDLGKRVARLTVTKNGHPREVPLSTEAVRLLRLLGPADLGPVFQLKASQIDALFRKARARAQIADLHFHDARHTAIGRLAQRLHVLDLARVTGHRDLRMLDRYYHATAEVLAERIG